MSVDLHELRHTSWEFTPFLHASEQRFGHRSVAQRSGKEISSGDGVLDREIDADAAGRRHGMGGIADAEEAGKMPALETIDPYREEFDLIPVFQFLDTIPKIRSDFHEVVAKGIQAAALDLFERSLSE